VGEKSNELVAITALKAHELRINSPIWKEEEEKVPPSHQPYPEPPAILTGDKYEQHGQLNGGPLAFFDEDRTKAQDFMHNFTLYWMQNNQHPMFTNLYY
jgi:hypothetical protein